MKINFTHKPNLITSLIYAAILLHSSSIRAEDSAELRFATQPTHQTAVLGSTVVLPCRVIPRDGTVQWTRDGFGLGTIRRLDGFDRYSMIGSNEEGDFSLRISPVTLEDDSEYQCQVSSKKGPKLRSRVARLTVFVPPESPSITPSPEVSATAGVNVTIKCESIGGRPAPEIQWLDNSAGLELREGIVYSENLMEDGLRIRAQSVLTFTPTRHHHSRTLTCLTHNPALNEPLASHVTLRVEFPPEVDIRLDPGELSEGAETKVTCQAEANPTEVKYKWLRKGKEISGATGPTVSLGVLTRADHGTFIACEATNAVGTIRRTQALNIRYAPRFETAPESESSDPEAEVTLRCKVDANPSPEITWHHVESNTIVGKGASLKVKASKETAGTYVCVALSRGFSPLEGRLHLRLRGPPVISASTSVTAHKGQSAELRCQATAVPHPLAVTWMKDGTTINPEANSRIKISEEQRADGVLSLLKINATEEKDFTAYNCSVVNEYGIDVHQIVLRRQAVIPVIFIVGGGVGVIFIVIIIILFIICGRKSKPATDPEKSVNGSHDTELNTHNISGVSGLMMSKQGMPGMQNEVTILPTTILKPDVTTLPKIRGKSDIRLSDNDSDTKDPDNRTGSSLSATDKESEHWDSGDKGMGTLHHLQYQRYSQSAIFVPQEQAYITYADYGRNYSPVPVGSESYTQFKLGGPYARSSPASDPPSSLPSSVAPPPYTPTPNGVVGVNGLTSRNTAPHSERTPNGIITIPGMNGITSSISNVQGITTVPGTIRHDLIADLQQPDLTREANQPIMDEIIKESASSDFATLHSKFILPPQSNIKPGTLV